MTNMLIHCFTMGALKEPNIWALKIRKIYISDMKERNIHVSGEK